MIKSFVIYIFILFLYNGSLLGQTFEGKIVYQNNYTSKLAQVKDEQFNTMMGTKQEYFIKGGSYKSITNGSFAQMQLYFFPAESPVSFFPAESPVSGTPR